MIRVGFGRDIHALYDDCPLVLGGVSFEDSPKGFRTHSDGDVVSHAIIDALAGAAGLGSLGEFFPEDDPDDEDTRSIEFLARFRPVLDETSVVVCNIDITVFTNLVRIEPASGQICRNIARGLGLPEGRVNVKGRSNDGFGPEGRNEAVSATVVVLVEMSP